MAGRGRNQWPDKPKYALIDLGGQSSNPNSLRKQIYRQLLSFQNNGWLRCEGTRREKRFYVTDAFKQQRNTSKNAAKAQSIAKEKPRDDNYSILITERCEHEGALKIVLGEIDEYRSLLTRFPSLEKHISPFLQESKLRSAELLGKVNVLSNVLNSLSAENPSC